MALKPETSAAFDHYIEVTERQMDQNMRQGHFLALGRSTEDKTPVEIRTLENGKPIRVPDGQIHDWTGGVFLKGATIQKVMSTMRDYDNYKNIYRPDVVDSKVIRQNGDDYDIFLRLYKKQVSQQYLTPNITFTTCCPIRSTWRSIRDPRGSRR